MIGTYQITQTKTSWYEMWILWLIEICFDFNTYATNEFFVSFFDAIVRTVERFKRNAWCQLLGM